MVKIFAIRTNPNRNVKITAHSKWGDFELFFEFCRGSNKKMLLHEAYNPAKFKVELSQQKLKNWRTGKKSSQNSIWVDEKNIVIYLHKLIKKFKVCLLRYFIFCQLWLVVKRLLQYNWNICTSCFIFSTTVWCCYDNATFFLLHPCWSLLRHNFFHRKFKNVAELS